MRKFNHLLQSKNIAEILKCLKRLNDYNEHVIKGLTSNRSKYDVESKLEEHDLEKLKKHYK